MLIKGTENVKWGEPEYNGTDKPAPEGELHWYEKVDFHTLGIPFCKRAPSNRRIYFSIYPNLEWKAAEVKESSFGKFKTTADVHRNAHYIGMYILEQMFVKHKKSGLEERIYKKMKMSAERLEIQETLMDIFKVYYEGFIRGGMSLNDLEAHVIAISEEISDPKMKLWFIEYCNSLVENKWEMRKIKDKLRKQEARARGIELV